MNSNDLTRLEFPRHLHKTMGAYLRVNSKEEAAAAIAEGWCVHVPSDDEPTPVAAPVPEPVAVPEPVKAEKPVKAMPQRRGRNRA